MKLSIAAKQLLVQAHANGSVYAQFVYPPAVRLVKCGLATHGCMGLIRLTDAGTEEAKRIISEATNGQKD